jgi:hypothetical protein
MLQNLPLTHLKRLQHVVIIDESTFLVYLQIFSYKNALKTPVSNCIFSIADLYPTDYQVLAIAYLVASVLL